MACNRDIFTFLPYLREGAGMSRNKTTIPSLSVHYSLIILRWMPHCLRCWHYRWIYHKVTKHIREYSRFRIFFSFIIHSTLHYPESHFGYKLSYLGSVKSHSLNVNLHLKQIIVQFKQCCLWILSCSQNKVFLRIYVTD
jgi:hypothetical protein